MIHLKKFKQIQQQLEVHVHSKQYLCYTVTLYIYQKTMQ
jgi:hypothetical protein